MLPPDRRRVPVALRSVYRPTKAQGNQQLLIPFWELTRPAATPEVFESFLKKYKAALVAIKFAEV